MKIPTFLLYLAILILSSQVMLSPLLAKENLDIKKEWTILFENGKKHMQEGRYQEAVDNLVGTLSLDPQNPRSLAMLGTIFYRIGKTEVARVYWEKGVIYNPENKMLQRLLQLVYKTPLPSVENMKLWKENHQKGEKFIFEGRNSEAIKLFDEALKYFPENRYSLFSRGMAFYQMGKMDEAKKVWKGLQKIDPANVMIRDVLRVLGTNQLNLREELEKKVLASTEDWKPLFELGVIYLKERKLEKAKSLFLKVLDINKGHTGSIQGLSVVALNRNKYSKSVEVITNALKEDPENKVLLDELPVLSDYRDIMEGAEKILNSPVFKVNEMVLVPAGEFTFGNYDPDTNVDERPLQQITLDAYYIDKYEVSNIEYFEYVQQSKVSPLEHWGTGKYGKYREYLPAVNVNWYEADRYCRWNGKRLPTEQEWEKAARGDMGLRFPWGDAFESIKENSRASYFRRPVFVTAYPEGASPYGAFNMAGNVWEWTGDWYAPYKGNDITRKEFGEKYKVQRGGSFLVGPIMHTRTSERDAQLPIYKHRTTGFRCVKDNKPVK